MRFCFVVHRYAPYPGGSEVFVQAMAEAALRRGHGVQVLAGAHAGDHRGVAVACDLSLLRRERFDLIIVHGAGPVWQNRVLRMARELPSPLLYLLIKPCSRRSCRRALRDAALLGWSSLADQRFLASRGLLHKAVPVRHGIDPETSVGQAGFRTRHGIDATRPMFLSCGGYWRHKRMVPLARLFERAGVDGLLVTTGYDATAGRMPRRSDRVLPLVIEDRAEVLAAIRDADCCLMHSSAEGFGLVLLEAMFNETPWIATHIAGAETLAAHGTTYRRDRELTALLRAFRRDRQQVAAARARVLDQHLISDTLDDLELAAGVC